MLRARIFLGSLVVGTAISISSPFSFPRQEPKYSNQQDQAGPYVITNDDHLTGKSARKDAEIRRFLWDQWRWHRMGKLVETRYSKEGVPCTTTFVLEPDDKGRWTVAVESRWPPGKGSTPEHDHSEYRVYSVRRIEPRHDGQSPAVFIPDEAERSADSYRLVFYNERAKETGGL